MAADAESKSNVGGANGASRANGVPKTSKMFTDPFEMFCDENREALETKKKDAGSDLNVDEELTRIWKNLPEHEKDEFQAKFDKVLAKHEEEKEASKKSEKDDKDDHEDADEVEDTEDKVDKDEKGDKEDKDDKPNDPDKTQDEDVEMANYDTEDQDETQADVA